MSTGVAMIPVNQNISQYTLERANRTRLIIENFYAQSLVHCQERQNRLRKLEEKMATEGFFKLSFHRFFFIFMLKFNYFRLK